MHGGGGGGKIVVGAVFKSKLGELEEEVREGFLRLLRKDLTGVFQGVSGKKRLLMRLQYGCKKDLTSNQLAVVILEKSPVEEESKVPMIPVIHD